MSLVLAALGSVVAVRGIKEIIRRRKLRASMAVATTARSILLKTNLDNGIPGPEHFEITSQPSPTDAPTGGLLLQALVFSADPYLRGHIRTGSLKPGDCMVGFIAGRVVASKHPDWAVGDLFGACLPFCTVQTLTAEQLKNTPLWKLTHVIDEAHISYGIGILGMPGSTAYGGLIDILQPKAGETIWVSGAAGAVGGLVGQMAKNVFGCKVVGSAGGGAKCNLVTNFYGFDACVDYKQATDAESLGAAVKAATKGQGIDMYFENIGGIHFEAAMANLRPRGRVAVCGTISSYNESNPVKEKLSVMSLIYNTSRIEGFVCHPWLTGKKGNFLPDMAKWLKEGKLRVEETTFDGVEKWPEAFQALFLSKNTGKVVVHVA